MAAIQRLTTTLSLVNKKSCSQRRTPFGAVGRRRLLSQHRLQSSSCEPEFASSQQQHANVIDVQELAQAMRREVREYTRNCVVKPKLVGILADRSKRSNNAQQEEIDAEIYSAMIHETLRQDGMEYELAQCSATTMTDMEQVIEEMNHRDDVHGILVFYPIFRRHHQHAQSKRHSPYMNASTGTYYKTQDDYLRDLVNPSKDVEALAVLKIIERYHSHDSNNNLKPQRWSGLTATIINRSEILGRPLAALMSLQGANVYSVDESSVLQFMPGGRLCRCHFTLENCLQKSSVVVTAVPSPNFVLPSESIQCGTMVINVAEHSNVDESLLLEIPNVKLVPQVGSCTVAALEQNLMRLHKQQMGF
ncbi:methylenetetrahydrofolate dehydrogenase [Mayamaea pseudoterrestris]|nr:methylenetetrahydrofolate dehydrogenase [Mayamaea pseudoterrestris]